MENVFVKPANFQAVTETGAVKWALGHLAAAATEADTDTTMLGLKAALVDILEQHCPDAPTDVAKLCVRAAGLDLLVKPIPQLLTCFESGPRRCCSPRHSSQDATLLRYRMLQTGVMTWRAVSAMPYLPT